jgi:hypothetical protein
MHGHDNESNFHAKVQDEIAQQVEEVRAVFHYPFITLPALRCVCSTGARECANSSVQSGIAAVSGWKCTAGTIAVRVDG